MPFIRETADGVLLNIYVQPRAAKTGFAGIHGKALKIRLTAPPADGAANKMCINFLAKTLKLPKSSIQLVSGQTSRAKRVAIRLEQGPGAAKAAARIKQILRKTVSPEIPS